MRSASAFHAYVTAMETERVREPPPVVFDLGTLQEVCSRQLGLDVQETLDIAQSLYEQHKATTYPRSDCGHLPESMLAEVPQVLDAVVAADPGVKPLVQTLDRSLRSRVWNDTKITAHHGIIPTLEPPNLFCVLREGAASLSVDPRALPGAIPADARVRSHRGAALLLESHLAGTWQAHCGARLAQRPRFAPPINGRRAGRHAEPGPAVRSFKASHAP